MNTELMEIVTIQNQYGMSMELMVTNTTHTHLGMNIVQTHPLLWTRKEIFMGILR